MRSGKECYADELVRDGRNPQLLVLPEWADPAHPQERPFIVNDVEGTPRFPVAPRHGQDVSPVLAIEGVLIPPVLTWSVADTIGPRIESYTVYRGVGGGELQLLVSLPVDFGDCADTMWISPTTYTDDTAEVDMQYHYRVDAVTNDGRHLRSNEVTVTTEAFAPPGPPILSGELVETF